MKFATVTALLFSVGSVAASLVRDMFLMSCISVICKQLTLFFVILNFKQNLRDRKLQDTTVITVSSLDSSSSVDIEPLSCKELIPDGTEFTIDTSWKLDKMTAVSYPCSEGYATNFAANSNLLDDVMDAVGPCFSKCNILNYSWIWYRLDQPKQRRPR